MQLTRRVFPMGIVAALFGARAVLQAFPSVPIVDDPSYLPFNVPGLLRYKPFPWMEKICLEKLKEMGKKPSPGGVMPYYYVPVLNGQVLCYHIGTDADTGKPICSAVGTPYSPLSEKFLREHLEGVSRSNFRRTWVTLEVEREKA